jgi:heat-inducible transcriptional repressor
MARNVSQIASQAKQEDSGAEARVSPRARLVLNSVVETYIATGEPVASQTIARQQNREGMSAATVRNVMADLSEAGYLDQPHTSAGRVPTPRAFRFYAEQILRRTQGAGEPPASALLALPAQEQIDESLSGVLSAEQFLARTSHVLAMLSGGVGVALTHPFTERELLEHVHFTRLGRARVLAVVVTTAGQVRDRVLVLDQDIAAADLEAAALYLNANFREWSLEKIRAELDRRLEQERGEYQRWLRSLEHLCSKGALDAATQEESNFVFVDGASNLIAGEADRERLRQILAALEEKQRVIELLRAYLGERQESLCVVVGLQEAMPEMRDLALIAAPARLGGERIGAVAVIGPTRMQYENAIGGVAYAVTLLERMQNTR